MDQKIKLICKLLLSYLSLLILCFLIYKTIATSNPSLDQAGTIIGLLGWSATLYAPIAAFFLLHNWREQVSHERAFDSLTNAYTLIGKIHSSVMKLKMNSYFIELETNFRRMNQSEFEAYANRLKIEFENKSDFLKDQYDQLNTAIAIYKLIKTDDKTDLDFVLDNYFRISYTMREIYNDVINIYLQAKLKNESYEYLFNHHLYKARIFQIKRKNHPDDGKNQDGSYLFFTTEYLLDIRDKSKLIMQSAIENL